MSYTYLKEITDWGDLNVKNHTYIFNEKNQNVGYIITGTKEELFYKKFIFGNDFRGLIVRFFDRS